MQRIKSPIYHISPDNPREFDVELPDGDVATISFPEEALGAIFNVSQFWNEETQTLVEGLFVVTQSGARVELKRVR